MVLPLTECDVRENRVKEDRIPNADGKEIKKIEEGEE